MSRTNSVKCLSVLALALSSPALWASTITYAVGTCLPGLHSFSTIMGAVTATPPPNVVKICPGTYHEQVEITQPITLEGVTSGNSSQAIIASPPNGLVVNASSDTGDAIAAQLFVEAQPGPILISNITLDAAGNGQPSPGPYIVGIFFQNASGTVNHVVTRNQSGDGSGVGIWIEGGASNPSVTVENSSVGTFDDIGIWTQTNAGASELTANIKSNTANGSIGIIDVAMGPGATATVSDNYLAGGATGVSAGAVADPISGFIVGNTIIDDGTAIAINADGVSVTGNHIFMSSTQGILVNSALPAVQRNTITGCPIGIELNGNGDVNVHSNTIIGGGIGLDQVPAGFAAIDSYFDVATNVALVAE